MLAAGLSMLWEAVDAEEALTARFGFAGWDEVVGWATDVLGGSWGIGVTGCSRLVISGPNAIAWIGSDHGDLVVKWSRARDRFAALGASTGLLRQMHDLGIPVAAPIAAVDGSDRVVLDGPSGPLSLTVLPERDGTWLDVADDEAVRSAGACLARVHAALGAISYDRATLPVRARTIGDAAQQQLVHNDFRAANVLMRGTEVVAVLDFDDVVVDHPASDLAKASVYLGTLFVDWSPTTAATREVFRAGYESVRPLGRSEVRRYERLVRWHLRHWG